MTPRSLILRVLKVLLHPLALKGFIFKFKAFYTRE